MIQRTNAQWLEDLRAPGDVQSSALADLRAILISGLPYALNRWLSPGSPAFDALIEESTQEALLRILDKLDTFEGRSRLTTWAQKIAVNIMLSRLRRSKWKDVSLDELISPDSEMLRPGLDVDSSSGPAQLVEQRDMLARVNRIIQEELTDKQRKVLMGRLVYEMPTETLAEQMGMEKNALYKLLHDARQNLRRRLESENLGIEDVLAAFDA